jgi:hypothetical protein
MRKNYLMAGLENVRWSIAKGVVIFKFVKTIAALLNFELLKKKIYTSNPKF